MMLTGGALCWFVTHEGVVTGDCGSHGEPDELGDVELGYGLAAPYRGRGYGTELVIGLSRWLLGKDGVRRVVASRVAVDNAPSRRALERSGFVLESADEEHTWYALGGDDVQYAPPGRSGLTIASVRERHSDVVTAAARSVRLEASGHQTRGGVPCSPARGTTGAASDRTRASVLRARAGVAARSSG
jgi:hypothetical protein